MPTLYGEKRDANNQQEEGMRRGTEEEKDPGIVQRGKEIRWEENRVVKKEDRRRWQGQLRPDRSRLWTEKGGKNEATGDQGDNRNRMATSTVVMHEPFRAGGLQKDEAGICFSSAVIVLVHEFGGWNEGVDYNHEPGGFAVAYTRPERRMGMRYPTMEEAFESACSRLVRQQRRIIEYPYTQNSHRQMDIIEWAQKEARENLAPVSEENPEMRWRVEQNALRRREGARMSRGGDSTSASCGEQAELFV